MTEFQSPESLQALEQHAFILIGALSGPDREALKSVSLCPPFCDDPAIRKLTGYMVDRLAKRPRDGFLLQILYWEVYRRKTVDPEKLSALLRATIVFIEDFIAWKALRSDPVKRAEYLTKHVVALPETTVFRASLSRWEQAIAEAPASYENLYQQFRISQEEWSHWSTDRYKKAPSLIQTIRYRHEEYCRTVRRMFDLGGDMRASLLTEADPAPDAPQTRNILLELSDRLIDLNQKEADEAGFLAFFDEYGRHFKSLGEAERESMFRSLINYCTRQMKGGHSVFVQHLSKLCKWAIRQNGFTARWLRSEEDFLNIAMAFCRPDALAEMKEFIQLYSKNLPEKTRPNATALALAYYHFFNGEPETALAYLDNIGNRQIPYKLRVHSLRIRVQYEIGKTNEDFDGLEKALEAYEKYFDRDEWLHDQQRENYMRLAWFVRKLATLARGNQLSANTDAFTYLSQALNDANAVKPIALEWVSSEIFKWRPNA